MIDDDYYESDEWIEIEEANRKYFEPEVKIGIHRPRITQDNNWIKLLEERNLPPLENKQVARIANCRFTVWHDSDNLSATYDISYASGKKILGRKTNGSWDNIDPRLGTENRVFDAIMTMVARSNDLVKIKFSRMYESNHVKEQVREINLIELNDGYPIAAWFIINDGVYPARLDTNFDNKYQWCFNGKKKIAIDTFCNWCWNIIK
jgi:hypothetical protein